MKNTNQSPVKVQQYQYNTHNAAVQGANGQIGLVQSNTKPIMQSTNSQHFQYNSVPVGGGNGTGARGTDSSQRPFEEEKWDKDSLSISPVRHKAGEMGGIASQYSGVIDNQGAMKRLELINFDRNQQMNGGYVQDSAMPAGTLQ